MRRLQPPPRGSEPTSSVVSQSSAPPELSQEERFNLALDNALGLKPGRRKRQLEVLSESFAEQYRPDLVEGNLTTLMTVLLSSAEKGGMHESNLAISLVGHILLSIPIHSLSSSEYVEFRDSFRRFVLQSRSGFVREYSGILLGILTLIGCEDETLEEEAYKWLFEKASVDFHEYLPSIAEPDAGLFNNACASAEVEKSSAYRLHIAQVHGVFQALLLLATGWDWGALADWNDPSTQMFLEICCNCITRRSSFALRLTAGYGFALLCEARRRKPETIINPEEMDELTDQVGAIIQRDDKGFLDELRRLCGAGTNTGRWSPDRGNKEDYKEQKQSCRDFLKLAEEGTFPLKTVSLGSKDKSVRLESFITIIRYELLRQVLRGSLQSHLINFDAPSHLILTCIDRSSNDGLLYWSDFTAKSRLDRRDRELGVKKREALRRRNRKDFT